jgi:PhnB protein
MKLNTHLNFNGNCREAFDEYAKIFGGKVHGVLTWGDSPMRPDSSPEMGDKVMHARIDLANATYMGSDNPPEWYSQPKGFGVTASTDTPEDAERIFAALSQGGEVSMPLQETFWAHKFGMVRDRFGIPWMVNCEKDTM